MKCTSNTNLTLWLLRNKVHSSGLASHAFASSINPHVHNLPKKKDNKHNLKTLISN